MPKNQEVVFRTDTKIHKLPIPGPTVPMNREGTGFLVSCLKHPIPEECNTTGIPIYMKFHENVFMECTDYMAVCDEMSR